MIILEDCLQELVRVTIRLGFRQADDQFRRSKETDYTTLLALLLEKENYKEMIEYGEKWYNWDKTSRFAAEYTKLAAQRSGNKSLEAKYDAIIKAMP